MFCYGLHCDIIETESNLYKAYINVPAQHPKRAQLMLLLRNEIKLKYLTLLQRTPAHYWPRFIRPTKPFTLKPF